MLQVICPNCQSSNTVRDSELSDNIFATVYECEDCGEMFSPDYWEENNFATSSGIQLHQRNV